MGKHAPEPIPGALFGVDTEYLDETTWDWLSIMQMLSRKPVLEGQVFLITCGASGVGEKLCVISALLAELAQYGWYLAHLASPQSCPQPRVYLEHPDAVFDTKV